LWSIAKSAHDGCFGCFITMYCGFLYY
jgi:hypothetical protein